MNFFCYLGHRLIGFFEELGQVSNLFFSILKCLPRIPSMRRNIFARMEEIGVESIPLVVIIAVFTGGVTAWQAAYQLRGIAPLSFLGTAVSRAIITELSPVLTALVMAGRIGSSIAASIGAMQVTEQIDALKAMGISPVRYLVMPRFVSSVLMMPLLVVFANLIALGGAYLISHFSLSISYDLFFDSVKKFFYFGDFAFGCIKGLFFGGVTALIGCHIGLRTTGGAEGVGQSTIRAFVLTSASILVIDYILWTLVF